MTEEWHRHLIAPTPREGVWGAYFEYCSICNCIPDKLRARTPQRIDGCEFLCQVPDALGAVVKMQTHRGRVVVTTESGIEMIVPAGTRQA